MRFVMLAKALLEARKDAISAKRDPKKVSGGFFVDVTFLNFHKFV